MDFGLAIILLLAGMGIGYFIHDRIEIRFKRNNRLDFRKGNEDENKKTSL